MPIDAYSLCPGGTGKKIKFCCSDSLGDLEKIERMLEGDQLEACLNFTESCLQKNPDRACMLATKAMLLRGTDRFEDAKANVAHFVEKHPENLIALAETAMITAVEKGGAEATKIICRAMALADGRIEMRTYEALEIVAQALAAERRWAAARALLQLQMGIVRDDQRPLTMLLQMHRSSDIPLLLKEDPPIDDCPDGAPYKPDYAEAVAPVDQGNWLLAAELLTALAEKQPDAPVVWQSLATIRGWLADTDGCVEALRKFAALDVPLETAVEAEAKAMLSSDDPLGDRMEMLSLLVTIKDFEPVETALLADARAVALPFDPSTFGDADNPPPKAAYLLLDRPIGESAENLTPESVARVLGQAMLYGRQTDRDARLELIGVAGDDVEALKALLGELGDDALDAEYQQEVMAHVSASEELLQNKWRPPKGVTREQFEELVATCRREAMLQRWTELKLGVLDGKTPREAAGEEAYRIKVLGAILLLEQASAGAPSVFDYNEIRSELGLPTLEAIDPASVSTDRLPLARLPRLATEGASDEALAIAFRRAEMFAVADAARKFATVVVERESLAGGPDQQRAYNLLARSEPDPEKSLQYITAGRQAALDAGRSCASWDLLELSYRFSRGEPAEARQLIEHSQSRHLEEPGVAESFTQLLVQVGVLRPDGTAAPPPPMQQDPMMASMDQSTTAPPAAAPPAAPADDGKIWTPGSEEPGGEKKLWTPD